MGDSFLQVLGLLWDQGKYNEILPAYESLDYVKEYFDTSGIMGSRGVSALYDGYYTQMMSKFDLRSIYDETTIKLFSDEVDQIAGNNPRIIEFVRHLTSTILSFGDRLFPEEYYTLVGDILGKCYNAQTSETLRILVQILLTKIQVSNLGTEIPRNILRIDISGISAGLINNNIIHWLDTVCTLTDRVGIFNRYSRSIDVTFDGVMNIVKYLWSTGVYVFNNPKYYQLITDSLVGITDPQLRKAINDAYQHIISTNNYVIM